MEGCEREIEIKSIALNRLMRNFTLVDVSEASIKTGEFNTEFNKVKDLCNDTVECIEKMLLDHKDSMNQLQIEQWTNQIQVIETTVSKYKVELRQKFTLLKPHLQLLLQQTCLTYLLVRQAEEMKSLQKLLNSLNKLWLCVVISQMRLIRLLIGIKRRT